MISVLILLLLYFVKGRPHVAFVSFYLEKKYL